MSKFFILLAVGLFLYRMVAKAVAPARTIGNRPEPPSERRSAHEVLGVEHGADRAEVRRAYQKKIQEYHPDKLHSAAPELRALAERRMKEINEAYASLKDRD